MKVIVSFTGGKDSVLALTLLQLLTAKDESLHLLPDALKTRLLHNYSSIQVDSLVTFAPAGSGVRSFKAHSYSIIKKQAEALGLPHSVVEIEGPNYQGAYQAAMRKLCIHEGQEPWGFVTGDILDVCSGFMEKAAAEATVPLVRPLWGISGPELLQSLWALGIEPMITCLNKSKFAVVGTEPHKTECQFQVGSGNAITDNNSKSGDTTLDVHAYGSATPTPGHCAPTNQEQTCSSADASSQGHFGPQFVPQVLQDPVGVLLTARLTPELEAKYLQPANQALGVHPCGEWGEFHTMCLDGPTFSTRLEVRTSIQQDAEFAWVLPEAITLVPKKRLQS